MVLPCLRTHLICWLQQSANKCTPSAFCPGSFDHLILCVRLFLIWAFARSLVPKGEKPAGAKAKPKVKAAAKPSPESKAKAKAKSAPVAAKADAKVAATPKRSATGAATPPAKKRKS